MMNLDRTKAPKIQNVGQPTYLKVEKKSLFKNQFVHSLASQQSELISMVLCFDGSYDTQTNNQLISVLCELMFSGTTQHPRHQLAEKLDFYNIPHYKIDGIKQGDDFEKDNGEIVKNDLLTFPPEEARSYAFCSDTAYREKIIPIIQGVDVLYHETTFLEKQKELAKKTFHSTAKQTGSIADQAKVGKLLIGHFSARYNEENYPEFISEVQTEFENVEIAEEGNVFTI